MTITRRSALAGAGFLAAAVSLGAVNAAQAETKWDMPTPYGDGNFHTQNIMTFADEISEKTGGSLTIQVHSAGSLFKHPEIKNAVRKGLAPIGELLISRLSNEDPVFGVDSVPFLANSYESAFKLYEASKPFLEKKLEEQGLKLLYTVPWPPQGIYAKQDIDSIDDLKGLKLLYTVPWPPQGIYAKQDIDSIDDLKGLKFRAYNATTERLAQLAGAVPTQVEVPDLPTAFSTGRVDAMITSPSTGANSKAWDYLDHYYDTQAWLPKNMVIVNARAFDGLTEAEQAAVMEAAAAAETRGWEASEGETAEKTKVLVDNGIAVAAPSEALLSSMKEIGATMTAEWAESAGEDGAAIVEAFEK